MVQKERMLKEINRLAKIKSPNIDYNKIPGLKTKIKELQLADQIKNQESQLENQNILNQSNNSRTLLTGFIIIINISEKQVA